MKEKLYTIPLNDAMNEQDECPLCFLERALLQKTMDFVLGSSSSYMESDVREKTDEAGFCRLHTKMMFDYGNALGNALILQTHMKKVREELHSQLAGYTPAGKGGLFKRITGKKSAEKDAVAAWTEKREGSCYICERMKEELPAMSRHSILCIKRTKPFAKR